MKSLIRREFLNQTWDANDLDGAAEFWLRLYKVVAAANGYSIRPKSELEIQVSGFSQFKGEFLQRELEERIAASDIPNATSSLRDSETLVISTGIRSGQTTPPVGLGLPLLAGSAFEGVVAEVRFRVIGRKGWQDPKLDVAMVIVGQLRDGKLLVKSVWRSHRHWDEDERFRSTPIEWETEWLGALNRFKESGVVEEGFAAWLSPPSYHDNQRRKRFRLINTPFGRPRWRGLLVRCLGTCMGVAVVVVAILALLRSQLPVRQTLVLSLIVISLATCVGLYIWWIAAAEWRLLFSYKSHREAYAKQFERDLRYAILTPDQSTEFADDPAIRKYTADLVAERFLLLGDVAPAPTSEARGVYRVFKGPDGITYFVLASTRSFGNEPETRVHVWPVAITFQAQTFFQGSGRVESVSDSSYGYQRFAAGPETLLRSFPDMIDPIEFYQLHTATLEAFVEEKGLIPAGHERFEDCVRRQQVIYEQDREYSRDHPYSWADHLRWYLQLPRKEQRT
jgi:hypothetical protein